MNFIKIICNSFEERDFIHKQGCIVNERKCKGRYECWKCPLTDDVNLEITFVYNKEDGWCHYCDLVYQSDDSSFDMLSGHGIDSILNVTDTVMDLCRDY